MHSICNINDCGSIYCAPSVPTDEITPAFRSEIALKRGKMVLIGGFPIAACTSSSPWWCHTCSVVRPTVPSAGTAAVCPSHGGSGGACTCAEQQAGETGCERVPLTRYICTASNVLKICTVHDIEGLCAQPTSQCKRGPPSAALAYTTDVL